MDINENINLTDTVKAAGVIGAGFPTHVKLSSKAECFIINAAECEPLIETDKYINIRIRTGCK